MRSGSLVRGLSGGSEVDGAPQHRQASLSIELRLTKCPVSLSAPVLSYKGRYGAKKYRT